MKEGAGAVAAGASGDGGGSGCGNSAISRSAVEKERTKLRERQRRSITTKIFAGLRKHGGYHLSPRADINQVLRELAKEAGWVVEPDGTTYRSTMVPPPLQPNASGYVCQACGSSGVVRSGTPTPSSSFIAGECSAIAGAVDPVMNYSGPTAVYHPNTSSSCGGSGGSMVAHEIPLGNMNNTQLAMHMMYGRLPSGGVHYPPEGGAMSLPPVYNQQQIGMSQVASNQTTPVGSPRRR